MKKEKHTFWKNCQTLDTTKLKKISFPLKKGLDPSGLVGFLQLLFTITWKSTLGAIR